MSMKVAGLGRAGLACRVLDNNAYASLMGFWSGSPGVRPHLATLAPCITEPHQAVAWEQAVTGLGGLWLGQSTRSRP